MGLQVILLNGASFRAPGVRCPMSDTVDVELGKRFNRRTLLKASAGLLLPRLSWAENSNGLALCWELDGDGDTATESVSGAKAAITGRTVHPNWVGNGRNRALRLDGYSVWINHVSGRRPLPTGELAITAWLALESYPVNEAAVVQQGSKSEGGVCFSIDKWGHLRFSQGDGSSVRTAQSEGPLPRGKWTHLAVSAFQSGETILYLDGSPCGRLIPPAHCAICNERQRHYDCEVERQPGDG